ncbi:MAG: saccharopine dehydrogenase family protein [Candidatus Hodarchaeota archaeon]
MNNLDYNDSNSVQINSHETKGSSMSRITVLGGCGTVGSIAVRTLASLEDFQEIIIADIDTEKAKKLCTELEREGISAIRVDALEPQSIKIAIKKSDVVLNCIGPFFKFAPIILKAVIESGIDYVDVCDDVDATLEILKMNDVAKQANVSAVIGMGSSPGVANLLVKFCADQLLEKIDSIDIYHAHGGEPTEGPAVIAHRIHSMSIPIPMFLDGRLTTVRFFEEDGRALQEDVDFHLLGRFKVYPYPHPETITLPRYIPCDRVTNMGCVLPPEYYNLIMDIVNFGLISEQPIDVKGQKITPLDFTIAFILDQREKILQQTKFGEQRGCLKIVIKGQKAGKPHQYVFSMASRGQSMGEGTGIPAALGATLMQRGKIQETGVLPPEACINPLEFLVIMQDALKFDKIGGEGSPLLFESINAEGNVKRLTL